MKLSTGLSSHFLNILEIFSSWKMLRVRKKRFRRWLKRPEKTEKIIFYTLDGRIKHWKLLFENIHSSVTSLTLPARENLWRKLFSVKRDLGQRYFNSVQEFENNILLTPDFRYISLLFLIRLGSKNISLWIWWTRRKF